MSRSASVAIIQQMEKSDKQTDVSYPENGVNENGLPTAAQRNNHASHKFAPRAENTKKGNLARNQIPFEY